MKGYPLDRIYEEVAFLAYYFHWEHDTIMNLDHEERRRWCEEVSRIHKLQNRDSREVPLESIY
ncbi:MAG: hypothetical protein GX267_18760 [Fibrobacter sp.]|nr:hypothetical protein [Fibrobacter sp.]